MSTPEPELALHLQCQLQRWPLPQLWHDVARLRAGTSVAKTVDGRIADPKAWGHREIYIPAGVLEGIMLAQGYFNHPFIKQLDPAPDWDNPKRSISRSGAIASWYCRWRLGKGAYRFHPLLWEAVIKTEMDRDIPVSCLYHLPEWGVLIETPPGLTFGDEGFPVLGIGLYLDNSYPTKTQKFLVARIYVDGKNRFDTFTRAFLLGGETLGECLEASAQYAWQSAIKYHDQDIMPILSIALYLCSRNRDINSPEGREFTPPGENTIQAGKKGLKAVAAGKIQNWHVGWRLGHALEASKKSEREPEIQVAKGVPRKPHIRRSHWHLYWAGPNRDIPRVHWLPPTPVNITQVTDAIPTVRPVKRS